MWLKCIICGKKFQYDQFIKCCSNECRKINKKNWEIKCRPKQKANRLISFQSKKILLKCVECDKPFEYDQPIKCCSDECRRIHKLKWAQNKREKIKLLSRPLVPCAICKKPFEKKRRNKCCSNLECKKTYKANTHREAYYRHLGKEVPNENVKCVICGNPFIKKGTKLCCSPKCSKQHAKNLHKLWLRKKHPLYDLICVECHNPFKHANKNRKCCSSKCTKKHSKKLSIKNAKKKYIENPEPIKARIKKWGHANANKVKSYKHKYAKSPKGKVTRLRGDIKKKEYAKFDKFNINYKDIKRILERDKVCVYCGSSGKLTIDHIIPSIKKGQTMINNLVLACNSCNGSKRQRNVFEWCKSKGREVPQIVIKLLEEQKKQMKLIEK